MVETLHATSLQQGDGNPDNSDEDIARLDNRLLAHNLDIRLVN